MGRWLKDKLGGPRLEPASRRAAGVWFFLALLATGACVLGGVLTLGVAQAVLFVRRGPLRGAGRRRARHRSGVAQRGRSRSARLAGL